MLSHQEESLDEQEIDVKFVIPICQLKSEPVDRIASKIKLHCQFCLDFQTEDCDKVFLDEDIKANYFSLTRKKIDTFKYSEFICRSCLLKFEAVIQYKVELLKNQKTLENWLLYSEGERDEALANDFGLEFLNLSSSLPENLSPRIQSSSAAVITFPSLCTKKTSKNLQDPVACSECSKTFSKTSHLRKHFNNVHKLGLDEVCQVCGKIFKNSKRLKAHLLTHETEKKYKCDQCPKQFVSSGDLSRHLRVHSQEKPFLCHVCSKSFRRSDALNLHMDIHSIDGFTCDMCASKFTNRRSLKEHIVKCVNNRNRQYRAPRLPRPARNSLYKDDPVYKCFVPDCLRQFTIRHSLGIHLDKVHSMKFDKFETTCLECRLVFDSPGEHASHVKTHTCKFVCDLCKVRFKTGEKLQAHMNRTHLEGENRPFICAEPNCGARFKRAAHLQSHRNYKHSDERKFECNICGMRCHERGSLNVHMRSHSNIKPFACWSCEYEGKTSSKLKQHMTLVHNESRIYSCKKCSQKFEFHCDFSQHEKEH